MNETARSSAADRMAHAAGAWLAALDHDRRRLGQLAAPGDPDSDRDRVRFFYTPTDHGGLALGGQTPAQQQLAMRLVSAGTSDAGYNAVAAVIGLENVLDRHEGWTAAWGRERGRDPGLYWLRVFGAPGEPVWGWRFGGHHVSLSFLVVDGAVVATTPFFLGADPARAPLPGGGELGPLAATEDLARRLMLSLDEGQRDRALLHVRAPSDIISGNRPRLLATAAGDEMMHMNDPDLWGGPFADPRLTDLVHQIDHSSETATGYDAGDHRRLALGTQARGVVYTDLGVEQQALLRRLVTAYDGRVAEDLRPHRTPEQLASLRFGWAGPVDLGAPHYHRVQGDRLVIEYDNTQRDANHAHSVWRDPLGDFGFDALAAHRRSAHS